jgi:hypothetical protein
LDPEFVKFPREGILFYREAEIAIGLDKQEKNDVLMLLVVALGIAGMLLAVILGSVLSHYRLALGIGSFAVAAGIIYDWYSKRKRLT